MEKDMARAETEDEQQQAEAEEQQHTAVMTGNPLLAGAEEGAEKARLRTQQLDCTTGTC